MTLIGYGGSIGSPSTAYLYDWNILPIGQLLWLKELMSYKTFPPMQAPETYNLDGILKEMQDSAAPEPVSSNVRIEGRLCRPFFLRSSETHRHSRSTK